MCPIRFFSTLVIIEVLGYFCSPSSSNAAFLFTFDHLAELELFLKMARLEKLQIQGFRSFSPDDKEPGPQKINFYYEIGPNKEKVSTRLTLILGQNGCGKTTIIE